jgi:uncharacterized repeat protein (TIGR01451 family)
MNPCQAKGMAMKGFTFAIVATAGLAVANLGSARPALAVPSGVGTAQETVNSLQAGGYTVVVKNAGNAPLNECTVSAVRPGHTSSRMDTGFTEVCVYVKC